MENDKKSFNQEWELIHSTQEWGMYPAEQVIRFVARNYYKSRREQIKILDFGCGAGAHTWYLAREGFDVYAFDGSESAIEKVRRRLLKEHLKADLKVADALALDYQDHFFDAVVDSVCIYSNVFENIKAMYQEVYRMLKPGGKLFSSCFGNPTSGYGSGGGLETDTFVRLTEGVLAGRGTTHFFTNEALRQVLEEAGFQNIQIDFVLYTDNGTQVEQFIATAEK